jgi:hypothetical protein
MREYYLLFERRERFSKNVIGIIAETHPSLKIAQCSSLTSRHTHQQPAPAATTDSLFSSFFAHRECETIMVEQQQQQLSLTASRYNLSGLEEETINCQ